MACGNSARENPNGEWLAETPQRGIQTENGLRKLRKDESRRRTACGSSARHEINNKYVKQIKKENYECCKED